MASTVDGKAPQDARFPTALAYAANVRSTYRPREEPRDFGSVKVKRTLFSPAVNGFGPRTIDRGPTVAPSVSTPIQSGTGRPRKSAGTHEGGK